MIILIRPHPSPSDTCAGRTIRARNIVWTQACKGVSKYLFCSFHLLILRSFPSRNSSPLSRKGEKQAISTSFLSCMPEE